MNTLASEKKRINGYAKKDRLKEVRDSICCEKSRIHQSLAEEDAHPRNRKEGNTKASNQEKSKGKIGITQGFAEEEDAHPRYRKEGNTKD